MIFGGSKIDGLTLEPDGLHIRGTHLLAMIGGMSFSQAVVHVLGQDILGGETAEALDCALISGLRAIVASSCSIEIAALCRQNGRGMAQTMMASLQGLGQTEHDEVRRLLPCAHRDAVEGLTAIAAMPALLSVWQSGAARVPDQTSCFVSAMLGMVSGQRASSEQHHLFEALLVSWMGGLGKLPPTVLIPRISSGTGVSVITALAAGFAAAGPSHVGATEQSLGLLLEMSARPEDDPESRVSAVLASALRSGQRIGGFGHPLFLADPRPPRVRAVAASMGQSNTRVYKDYDAACRYMIAHSAMLEPNIDFATGAVCALLGIHRPGTAAGLAMTARMVGMLAHILERRSSPPFGVHRGVARQYLQSLELGWL